MIEILFFGLGFLLFLLDTAVLPVLSNFVVMTNLTLFYSFHLYEIKKESSFGLFVFLLILKAILVPTDKLMLFLLLYMGGFILFVLILQGVKLESKTSIGVVGLMVCILEFYLFKNAWSPALVLSLMYQGISWLCMLPMMSGIEKMYLAKIKGKGVFV